MINFFKMACPILMVIGALGSAITNVVSGGEWSTTLQWIGAMLLYTALTMRNI